MSETFFPWDDVREQDTLATGTYRLSLQLEQKLSNAGKLQVSAMMRVIEPIEFLNQVHIETFTMGTEEAPNAIVAGTMGAKNFKKLCIAAAIPKGNLEQMIYSLNSSQVVADIIEIESKNENFRFGELINRVTKYYKVGEKTPKLAPDKGGIPGMGVGMTPGQMAAPVPPAMPAMAAPAMPAAPAQVAAAPAAPAALSPAAPTPPAAPVAPPAPPVAPIAPPVGGPTLLCAICNRNVPVAEFGAHVGMHQANPSWDGISPLA